MNLKASNVRVGEDPRVAMTEEGLYVMLYTAWNRKTPAWLWLPRAT